MKIAIIVIVLGVSMHEIRNHVHSAEPPAKGNLRREAVEATGSIFKGSFGEQFRYTTPMNVQYNPHGSADRAFFIWEGAPVGGMVLGALPPKDSEEEDIKAVITKGLKSDLKGTSIAYSKFKNSAGCEFQMFTCDIERNNDRFAYFLFMFIDTRRPANLAQQLLREKFGCYKFDFLIPRSKDKRLRNQVDYIVDTFTPPAERDAK